MSDTAHQTGLRSNVRATLDQYGGVVLGPEKPIPVPGLVGVVSIIWVTKMAPFNC